jgi:omega-6 fatty acid desaturase (delta-12 desaturase)
MTHAYQPHTWLSPERYARLMRRQTMLPLLILGRDALIYVVSLGVAIAPVPWLLSLAASVWAGLTIGAIFVAGHDACHQALTPHRRLNNWIGRLALAPSWTTRSLWTHFHNRIHHVYTNIIGVDYAVSPMSLDMWHRSGPVKQTMYRLYRSPVGFLPYYLIEMWWKNHLFPWDRRVRALWRTHLPDALFALLWQLAMIGLLLLAGELFNPRASVWHLIWLGWLLPFLVWTTLMGVVIYAHHTHPDIAWYAEQKEAVEAGVQITGVAHAVLPQPLKMLSSDIMEHTAHHVLPTIPHYRLAEAQRELELRFPSIPRLIILSRRMLEVIRACKLYDTEQRCWVDFAGRRTGPIHTTGP